jgi:hypothetical protein
MKHFDIIQPTTMIAILSSILDESTTLAHNVMLSRGLGKLQACAAPVVRSGYHYLTFLQNLWRH